MQNKVFLRQSKTAFVLCGLIIAIVASAFIGLGQGLAAGGSNAVCSGKVCYMPLRRKAKPKPNPDVQNRRYAKQALHKVFTTEETQFLGLYGFIDNVENAPFKRAFTAMQNLRQQNEKANADDLTNLMTTEKNSYLLETGIQQWIDAYLPPIISNFSPHEGIVGDTVTIVGEQLANVTEVFFLHGRGAPKVISEQEIQVAVPNNIGGITFPLEVISPQGRSISAAHFTQITGDCSDVRIRRAMWELLERRPRGIGATGECDPRLYNSGKYQNYEQLLTYMQQKYGHKQRQAPQITQVSPLVGPSGTKVRIDGNNLYQLKKIYFGTKEASFSSASEYLAFAYAPEGGSGTLRVDTYSGFGYYQPSYTPVPLEFTVMLPPTLTGFDPHDLLVGDTLRILGGNFGADPTVRLPGLAGFYITAKAPTEIHVRMTDPGKNIGVAVRTGGGEVTSGGTFTVWTGECRDPWIIQGFLDLWERKPYGQGDEGQCEPAKYRDGHWTSYEDLKFGIRQRYGYKEKDAPTISKIEPSVGVAGQWVTIFGAGFDEVRSVIFGNNTAEQVERRSSSELRAKIRFGTASGDVYVSTLYGVGKFSGFTIGYPPVISSVLPTEALPGVEVYIRGQQLAEVDNVSFSNTFVVVKSKTGNEIVAVVPKGLSGQVKITVSSSKGSSSWEPFGIVAVKLNSPTGKLRDVRLEFFSPSGAFLEGAPLIGNAGAGLTDAQMDALIGNAGAGIIGNTAGGLANVTPLSIQDIATLVGNTGAGLNSVMPLLGNTAGGLSQAELAQLIGNTAGGLIGNTAGGLTQVTPLLGNTAAGLVEVSMSVWSGIALADLTANTGAALVGNTGAGLVIPDSSLTQPIINVGETFSPESAFSRLTSTTGAYLAARGALNLAAKRSILQITPAIAPAPAPKPPALSPPTPVPKVMPKAKPTPTSEPAVTIPYKPPVSTPAPAAPSPPVVQPAPVPAPAPESEPARPACSSGSTYSVTFGRCLEDRPAPVQEERPACPAGQSYSITLRQCVQ